MNPPHQPPQPPGLPRLASFKSSKPLFAASPVPPAFPRVTSLEPRNLSGRKRDSLPGTAGFSTFSASPVSSLNQNNRPPPSKKSENPPRRKSPAKKNSRPAQQRGGQNEESPTLSALPPPPIFFSQNSKNPLLPLQLPFTKAPQPSPEPVVVKQEKGQLSESLVITEQLDLTIDEKPATIVSPEQPSSSPPPALVGFSPCFSSMAPDSIGRQISSASSNSLFFIQMPTEMPRRTEGAAEQTNRMKQEPGFSQQRPGPSLSSPPPALPDFLFSSSLPSPSTFFHHFHCHTARTNFFPAGPASLPSLPEGAMGKLILYKSGRMMLRLNNGLEYQIHQGVKTKFAEEVVSIQTEEPATGVPMDDFPVDSPSESSCFCLGEIPNSQHLVASLTGKFK